MEAKQVSGTWWRILTDPRSSFRELADRKLETVLVEYLALLGLAALAGGLYIFVETMGRAAFFDAFLGVGVDYWRMANYAMGSVTAVVMFFLFAGTFLAFAASLLLRLPYRNVRYVDLVMALMYALSPSLFFGWILWLAPATLLWSAVLLYAGVPVLRRAREGEQGTIEERE